MAMSNTYWLLLLFSALFLGCASSYQQANKQPFLENQSYYTSAHPTRNISEQLEQIQHSVKRISSTAIYKTYYFDNLYIRAEQLKYVDIEKLATRTVVYNQSTAGTAFIIARGNNNAILLSCAHVVTFPDTLTSYVNDGSVNANSVINAISIKTHQSNVIHNLPYFRTFEIVARDNADDLTLLSVDMTENEDYHAPPLPIEMGNPKDLRLGSYVMVMGYPKGYQMVTGGMISEANRDSYGSFMTDALFNHGISGGMIMATRNNYRSFEWVGVASSTAADKEMRLVPNPLTVDSYQPFEPYSDSIFVQPRMDITYGITQAIPVTKVAEFLQENEKKLARLGVDVDNVISFD